MNQASPIILFVYNRPYHTARTLDALERNVLAQESCLYVFADGAKNPASATAVQQVRDLLQQPRRFKEMQVVERDRNLGLANNVMDGVRQVLSRHGKAIVLEDDVLFSPHTLEYFNTALDKYADTPEVMDIGAFMYTLKKHREDLPEAFFTRYVASQAWATWSRAWQHFDPDITHLTQQFDREKIARFTFGNTMNFWRQIQQQRKGTIDSWAVRWYASVFLKNGLSLQPSQSLIENIGHDGSGIHSEISQMFDTTVRSEPITLFPEVIEEDMRGYEALKYFFRHRKGSLGQRIRRYIRNKILPLLQHK